MAIGHGEPSLMTVDSSNADGERRPKVADARYSTDSLKMFEVIVACRPVWKYGRFAFARLPNSDWLSC